MRRLGLLLFALVCGAAAVAFGFTAGATTSRLGDPRVAGNHTVAATGRQLGVDIWWKATYRDTLAFDRRESQDLVRYLVEDLHANAVTLCFPVYTASIHSDTVFTNRSTPSTAAVTIFLDAATRAGLAVALRPLLNVGTTGYGWRGKIHPVDLSAFFASYATVLRPYLQVAQRLGVPRFVYASEFWSLSNKAADAPRWSELLRRLGQWYHGRLEYDSSGVPYRLHENKVPGYADLADAYFQVAASPAASEGFLYHAWARLLASMTPAELRRTVFQEVGFVAEPDGYRLPAKVVPGRTDTRYLFMQGRWFDMVCHIAENMGLSGVYFWTIYFNEDPLYPPANTARLDPTSWIARPGARAIAACFAHYHP